MARTNSARRSPACEPTMVAPKIVSLPFGVITFTNPLSSPSAMALSKSSNPYRVTPKSSSEKTVREIKRRTRRKYSAEEKIRIIMDGLRGEDSIAEICRREGIHQNMYYKWSRTFLEAGKKRLMGDTMREAGTDEVKEIRQENMHLKQLVADLALKHSVLKKRSHGLNIDWKE